MPSLYQHDTNFIITESKVSPREPILEDFRPIRRSTPWKTNGSPKTRGVGYQQGG